MRSRAFHILLPAVAGLLIGAGCQDRRLPHASAAQPRTEDMSSGPVMLTLIADPPMVDYSRDILLTLRATSPSNLQVCLPSLRDRAGGFTVSEYDREPIASAGKTTVEHFARLTPVPGVEHRLAPMAITYVDLSRVPPATNWFPTRPLVFESLRVVSGKLPSGPHDIHGLIRIYPPFTTVLSYLLILAAAIAGAYFLWRLSRRIHRQIRLYRMSPRERALHELDELLAKRLVESDRVKDFYFELTMIVRRYIERAHCVRAPEQTTEEFLESASRNAAFSPAVVARLQGFMQAADLVKYAALRPAPEAVRNAIGTAQEYIETDASEEPRPGAEASDV